jgi:diaminohydroxyphosphoribosylaminopyrimidine deaminase/5-amino-6-(5-phosphoribosylamino)uracil reductase
MAEALALAHLGEGCTAPNPPVGAVVVRDGQVVGRGYHPQAGMPHAEVFALQEAGDQAVGADLYVTLEPCPHHGRTPPCTEAIARTGIRRVVVATRDPNPRVNGEGLRRLRELGVQVEVGDGEAQAQELLRFYRHHVTTGLPYVIYKYAVSLDGRVAREQGAPTALTGPAARRLAHQLRRRVDAVVVGVGTALADDPLLTVRWPVGGQEPLRVVVDSHLRLPPTSRLLTAGGRPPWVVAAAPLPQPQARRLAQAGARVVAVEPERRPGRPPRVSVPALLRELGRHDIMGVLLEGGPTLAASFLEAQAIHEIWAFVAPRLVGGETGPPPLAAVAFFPERFPMHLLGVGRVGEDLWVRLRREEGGACSPAS